MTGEGEKKNEQMGKRRTSSLFWARRKPNEVLLRERRKRPKERRNGNKRNRDTNSGKGGCQKKSPQISRKVQIESRTNCGRGKTLVGSGIQKGGLKRQREVKQGKREETKTSATFFGESGGLKGGREGGEGCDFSEGKGSGRR